MKNIKFKKFVRIVLAFLSTFFLVLMVWILIDCFTSKSMATKKIITYKVENDIDYEVILKENQFYTSDEANKNNRYVTSLMDTLEVFFDYELSGNNFFSGDYIYNVNLELVSNHDGEVMWKYNEEIVPQILKHVDDVMVIKIKDSVIVDIDSLYSRAQEFKILTGYDVKLKVDVNIDGSLVVDGYKNKVNDKKTMSLTVPLTKKVVNISTSSNNKVNKSVEDYYEVDEDFNSYLFIVSGLLILSLIPITIMSYASLFNLVNLVDYYRKLDILKKKYKRFIMIVEKRPDFKDKEVIDVLACVELARICIEKEKLHIDLYIDDEIKKSFFYVIDGEIVYLYTLELNYEFIDMSDKSRVIFKKKSKDDSKKS